AALSIGVGVVAVVLALALANGFLWQPFPYQDQDRIAMVLEATQFTNEMPAAPANYFAWGEAAESVESLEAWSTSVANLSGLERPEEVQYGGMTVGLLRTLGRQPVLGRGFRPDEGVAGANHVVLLDHGYWQARFDGDPDVLGRVLELDGVPHTVVGVMPEDFELFPANLDLYRPLALERDDWERSLMVVGRLGPDRTVEQLESELAAVTTAMQTNHPSNENLRAQVRPIRAFFPGPTDTRLIQIFLIVGGFVLVIAAANVAGLLLSRAQGRDREIAVRTALGAPRHRIVAQLLTEAVLLALVGAAIGTVGSVFAVQGLAAAMPAEVPDAFMPRLDAVVLLLTLAVAVFAGLLFGASPAFHALRSDLRGSLSETGRGGTGARARTRARSAFVVGEFAVALALLTGAGLLVRTFDRIVNAEPGFRADHVLTMRVTLPERDYPDDAAMTRFHDRLEERLAAVPGVRGVTLMNALPRSRYIGYTRFATRDQLEMAREEQPGAVWQPASPSFFQVIEGSIVRGRGIQDTDRATTTPVVVINQRLAERY
ncbi:MAG: FtsX-like permease family protein, partial [Gammaproteobacteria bacterium]|nr:FtsX-like permease family protein [Gemmatimonadota bacterium]NIU76884.1 FtsX-like permease family protein [Gammaproteobacteria bacterium]